MPNKKKRKRMTLSQAIRGSIGIGEGASNVTMPDKRMDKLERGYQNYRKQRILEHGGEAAVAPKSRWMDIWKKSKRYE